MKHQRGCRELFGHSRRAAVRLVAPFLDVVPGAVDLPRVGCHIVCDASGNFVFGSILRWNAEDGLGESAGFHVGTEDPQELDIAHEFLKALIAHLEGAVLVSWDVDALFAFMCRHASLPGSRRLSALLDERSLELKPVFERLGRGGYRPCLQQVAFEVAGVPPLLHLNDRDQLLELVMLRDPDAAERPLALDSADERSSVAVSFWPPEAWAACWLRDGHALWEILLERDAQLRLHRLQEVDRWILDEIIR